MIKFKVERACFEDDNNGFCYVVIRDDSEGKWIEIHANEEKCDYPLCFSTKDEIDAFADKLKSFL